MCEPRFLASGPEILAAIQQEAARAESWKFCVARIASNGDGCRIWTALQPYFGKLQLAIVGLQSYETEPSSLRRLLGTGKLRVVPTTESSFRANVLCFEGRHRFTAIVGSSGLVGEVFDQGTEAAVQTTCNRHDPFEDAVQAFLADRLREARMVTASDIREYARTARIRKQVLEETEKRLLPSVTPEQFARATRRILRSRHRRSRQRFLREIAAELGYNDLATDGYEALNKQLVIACERGLARVDTETVQIAKLTIDEYSREDLVDILLEIMEGGEWLDRDEVMKWARAYLGFPRLNKSIRKHLKSAIRSALHRNLLEREGVSWIRRST